MRHCDGNLHPRARQGVLLFNRGQYFHAHEELEIAWREETARIRQLYQGILEAGVVYLHLQRGNLAGAMKVHKRCIRWLEQWPEVCRGVHIGQLRRDLDAILAEALRLGPTRLEEVDGAYFQQIRMEEGVDGPRGPKTETGHVVSKS